MQKLIFRAPRKRQTLLARAKSRFAIIISNSNAEEVLTKSIASDNIKNSGD